MEKLNWLYKKNEPIIGKVVEKKQDNNMLLQIVMPDLIAGEAHHWRKMKLHLTLLLHCSEYTEKKLMKHYNHSIQILSSHGHGQLNKKGTEIV